MRFYSLLFFLTLASSAIAQLDSTEIVAFQNKEKQLITIGETFINAEQWEERQSANHAFIKELTKILKTTNSYQYSFPELKMVSIIKPKDDSFRIFTWQVETQGQLVRHFGAIQKNAKELDLVPLIDTSDDVKDIYKHSGTNQEWYGTLYYAIEPIKLQGKQAYLLFGLDTYSPFSKRKVLEVLHFNDQGQPNFGAGIFPNAHKPKVDNRFILEYRGTASASMRFNPAMGKIIFDHVAPATPDQEGVYAFYVPDGTYDALVWEKGRFYYEKDVIATNFENLEELKNKPKRDENKSDEIYKSNSKGTK